MRGVKPSLLFLSDEANRKHMPAGLAADLNLDRLLTKDTLGYMLTVTDPDELSARQDIFRRMEDEAFLGALNRLSESLTGLIQATEACSKSGCELEELLLTRGRFKAYLSVCDQLEQLSGSPLLDVLKERIGSLAGIRAELAEALKETDGCIDELSETGLVLESPTRLKLRRAEDEGMYERMTGLMRGFGLEPKLRNHRLRASSALSEAMAALSGECFDRLRELRRQFEPRLGPDLTVLRRELEFYLELHSLIGRGRRAGFSVCFPELTDKKCFCADDAYDFTLLVKDCAVVPNDIDFDEDSAVCFLTGANGGGKTTYLRSTAANLLLALCGCPIFASRAELYKFDYVCAHFPADESFTSSGRLVEEAARVDAMLADCGADSFVFMNETYSGTDDIKGAQMTLDTAERIKRLGAFSLWVTHFHEVSDRGYTMLTTVIDESDSSMRTFRIVKKRGDGSSYARDILKKYRLDAASLAEREKNNA